MNYKYNIEIKRLKIICIIIGCLVAGCSIARQRTGISASPTKIVYTGTESEAIQDLRSALTGYDAGTINISHTDLGNRTGQEFFLEVKSKTTIIRYTTPVSLENAIYTYLDKLGFRWYGPGENWFVKPKVLAPFQQTGKWVTPTFRNRQFFGTGGLDVPLAFDKEFSYRRQWYAWKRRNRFNVDFPLTGHIGQAFYLSNKKLLDENPQWFANEQGKKNGRIKIDDPAAVMAFKKWIKDKYDKSGSAFTGLSVEPEDGRGGADDPLPQKMKQISNHADKWWWLANEVARDYPETNKRVAIIAMAYGDGPYNALVPQFPLRKNVYPVIAPYAFQKAYQPSEMVKVWSAKVTGKMGMYDYWNITQWSLGMPQFNIYTIPEKLKFWSQHKVDGVYLETTDAAGPMGHALWLTGQMQWDLAQDFEKLYVQYLTDCFGKAAPVMRRMFDRWSKNYQQAAEVSLSLNDLQEATALVNVKSAEWKRINELKAYVHFMKLYYQHDGTQASKDRMFNYLYRIHHLMMVQTSAFAGQHYIAPLSKGNIIPQPGRIVPLSEEEIERQFNEDCREEPVLYKLLDFTFDFSKVKYTSAIDSTSWRFGGYSCQFFFFAPFTGKLVLEAGAQSVADLRIFSDKGSILSGKIGSTDYQFKETLTGRSWFMKKISIDIKKGEKYTIQTSGGFSRIKVKTSGIVLFKNPGAQDFDNYAYPAQYFYVPKTATEIVFYDSEPESISGGGSMITPDGKRISRTGTGVKNIYRVPVEPAYRGKVWTARFGHPTWSLKNIPNIASLQKFEYVEN